MGAVCGKLLRRQIMTGIDASLGIHIRCFNTNTELGRWVGPALEPLQSGNVAQPFVAGPEEWVGLIKAEKVFVFGLWPSLSDQLLPFLNAVRGVAGLPALSDLPS